MKRNVYLMILVAAMVASLCGCIIGSSPTASTVTLKVNAEQTFAVKGFMNGAYTWYKGANIINGATSASYTYTALAADKGTFVLKVQTIDLLNKKVLVKQWTVKVVQNLPPIANAGADLEFNLVSTGMVQLDGSKSYDPDGDTLSYYWRLETRPTGSSTVLSDAYSVNPSFTPDLPGAYSIRLIVSDGEYQVGDTVTVNAYMGNRPPTANAGTDAEISWGATATLDGSASTDPDGDTLTYEWRIVTIPSGSTTATISNPISPTPTFTPDVKGEYTLGLVVNDGEFNSAQATVTVTVTNRAPIANAGEDDMVDLVAGETYTLDGTGSSDPDDNPLVYTWTIISAPAGSAVTITNPTSATPTFTPDIKGAYTFRLTVSDGDLSSADEVIISTSNHIPVANANSDIEISFGNSVNLTGALSSDPDGDTLTYAWTVYSAPGGSAAVIVNPTSMTPTFKPDVKGVYEIQLIVNDGTYDSAPDTMTITTKNDAPVAEAGADILLHFPGAVQLAGSGTDANGDALAFRWTVKTKPAASTAALLSDSTIATPTFTPDVTGDYVLSLVVNDGEVDSAEDTVSIIVYNNAPTANAGSAQSVFFGYGASVQLNGSGTDSDGDTLSFAWSILRKPAASTGAGFSNSAIAQPTFTPDALGAYTLQLVVSDGYLTGTSTVVITAYNDAPVANAGVDQTGYVNTLVTLAGSGSDPNGYAVNYTWSIVSVPTGSTVTALSNPYIAGPTFTPDKKGQYIFSLVVDDGIITSAADTVTITVVNRAPVAVATVSSSTILFGTTATLYGSTSYDPDGTALTYAWTKTSYPSGSTAALSSATAANPTFKPDKEGSYTFTLVVSDGDLTGSATVTITTFTYNQGFESGIVTPWGVVLTNAAYSLSTDYVHGGSISFKPYCPTGHDGNNQLVLSLTFPQATYVYSISCWMHRRGSASSAVHSELYVDSALMLNGSPAPRDPHTIDGMYHILDPATYNTWVQRTWAVNAQASVIKFVYNDLYIIDNIYLDDIVINTWGS